MPLSTGSGAEPGHRPVLVHDLADDAGRIQARQPGEIDRRLGRPARCRTSQGLERSGRRGRAARRVRALARVDRDLDRVRAIVRGNPVVTPSRASTETVNARPCGVSLWSVICRRPSASQRSSVRHRRISPRVTMAMKLIASGVANWAAIVRSAFVLAVRCVDDDDELALADVLDRLFDDHRKGPVCGVAMDAHWARSYRRWADELSTLDHVDLEVRRGLRGLSGPSVDLEHANSAIATSARAPRSSETASTVISLAHAVAQHLGERRPRWPPPPPARASARCRQRPRDPARSGRRADRQLAGRLQVDLGAVDGLSSRGSASRTAWAAGRLLGVTVEQAADRGR